MISSGRGVTWRSVADAQVWLPPLQLLGGSVTNLTLSDIYNLRFSYAHILRVPILLPIPILSPIMQSQIAAFCDEVLWLHGLCRWSTWFQYKVLGRLWEFFYSFVKSGTDAGEEGSSHNQCSNWSQRCCTGMRSRLCADTHVPPHYVHDPMSVWRTLCA